MIRKQISLHRDGYKITFISVKEGFNIDGFEYDLRLIVNQEENRMSNELFISTYKIDSGLVDSFGDPSGATEPFIEKYIPHVKKIHRPVFDDKAKDEKSSSYYCFQREANYHKTCGTSNLSVPNVILHASATSSWKCLLEVLGETKYLIITKEKIDDTKRQTDSNI